jgi:hypothetical protein
MARDVDVEDAPEPIARLGIDSGLQFLQLALDQVLGVLRIGGAKGSQSDGGTTLWDDHEISPHQRVAFHRDVVDIRKRNRCRSSSTDSKLPSDGGFCWISSRELERSVVIPAWGRTAGVRPKALGNGLR